MSFNSYHRRGSRSAVHATLSYRNSSEGEDLQYLSVGALDVHILNNPTHHDQETVSEDSRICTNEVKSEEFAILSTSSESEGSGYHEEEEELPLSNSQRIDDWCLQNGEASLKQHTRTNKRIQDIIKAWGVDEETPLQSVAQEPYKEIASVPLHPDNYTAHLLDKLTPNQKFSLQRFANQTMPLLKRQCNIDYPLHRFRSVPSVFAQRELLWTCSLQNTQISNLESICRYLWAVRSEDSGEKISDDRVSSSRSRSSSGIGSWHSWNIVPRLKAEDYTGY